MNTITPLWLGLAFAGFVLGLFVRPMVLLRIAIALFMLSGLGLLLANTSGSQALAYWFGAGMVAIAVIFGVAIVGAIAGRLVRRLVHAEEPRRHERQYNSILTD